MKLAPGADFKVKVYEKEVKRKLCQELLQAGVPGAINRSSLRDFALTPYSGFQNDATYAYWERGRPRPLCEGSGREPERSQ